MDKAWDFVQQLNFISISASQKLHSFRSRGRDVKISPTAYNAILVNNT